MPFDWGKNTPVETFGVMSEDEDTSLEGFDSEVPPEDAKWLTTDKKRLEQIGVQERQAKKTEQPVQINVPEDLMGQDEPESQDESLSEVEFRLEKAQCYKMLINHQLLSADSRAAEEVEVEVQEFVRKQLGRLMGMTSEPTNEGPVFTNDEAAALRAVANKVLGKPTLVSSSIPTLTPAPAPKAARVTPAPVPAGEIKRGRGRPRKYPCQNCGKIACECKTVAETKAPVKKPQFTIETLPDGTRIKHVGNRRYKLVRRPVMYKDGTTGEEDIEMDVTPRPKPPQARPYPTEQQVATLAESEASHNLGKSSNLIKGLTAVSIAKQQEKGEVDEYAS